MHKSEENECQIIILALLGIMISEISEFIFLQRWVRGRALLSGAFYSPAARCCAPIDEQPESTPRTVPGCGTHRRLDEYSRQHCSCWRVAATEPKPDWNWRRRGARPRV